MPPRIPRQTVELEELSTADYDQPVVDYASGLRRQAMQAAQDAKRSAGASERDPARYPDSQHRLSAGEAQILLDLAPSPAWYRQACYALGAPFAPESRSSEPAPERSRLETLNHVLRRAVSKKEKQRVIKSISAPIQPELNDEASVQLEAGPSKTPDPIRQRKRRGVVIGAHDLEEWMRRDLVSQPDSTTSSSASVATYVESLVESKGGEGYLHHDSGSEKKKHQHLQAARLKRRGMVIDSQEFEKSLHLEHGLQLDVESSQESEADLEDDIDLDELIDDLLAEISKA